MKLMRLSEVAGADREEDIKMPRFFVGEMAGATSSNFDWLPLFSMGSTSMPPRLDI